MTRYRLRLEPLPDTDDAIYPDVLEGDAFIDFGSFGSGASASAIAAVREVIAAALPRPRIKVEPGMVLRYKPNGQVFVVDTMRPGRTASLTAAYPKCADELNTDNWEVGTVTFPSDREARP